jgi:hypothetical protein
MRDLLRGSPVDPPVETAFGSEHSRSSEGISGPAVHVPVNLQKDPSRSAREQHGLIDDPPGIAHPDAFVELGRCVGLEADAAVRLELVDAGGRNRAVDPDRADAETDPVLAERIVGTRRHVLPDERAQTAHLGLDRRRHVPDFVPLALADPKHAERRGPARPADADRGFEHHLSACHQEQHALGHVHEDSFGERARHDVAIVDPQVLTRAQPCGGAQAVVARERGHLDAEARSDERERIARFDVVLERPSDDGVLGCTSECRPEGQAAAEQQDSERHDA